MHLLRSPLLVAFAVVLAAHLVFILTDLAPWVTVTKCLLAPLLAAWVVQQHGPWVIVLALVFCFLGDLFLDLGDSWFLPGMGAFAAAHVCFVTFFVRHGALEALRDRPWIALVLLAVAVALLAWAWPGLEPGLRGPVVVYALLLSSTAATALALDARAGVGALLFLFSDGLIALRIADRVADSPMVSFTIMATYGLALFLLATGSVDLEADAHELTQAGRTTASG